jgi:hypothetical protein
MEERKPILSMATGLVVFVLHWLGQHAELINHAASFVSLWTSVFLGTVGTIAWVKAHLKRRNKKTPSTTDEHR